MRVVAADGAGGRAHRDRGQAHPFIGAQIADHVAVVGVQRRAPVDVEVVAVLHKELAPPHHAEPGPHLVAELPLDVVERQRQLLVAVDVRPEDVGHHLLIRGAVEQVALLPVGDAQHLLAVVAVAAGFPPQVGGLQRRHQKRDVARALLFLMHDLLDAAQHAVAERQPGIDARRLLLYHARAQHQAVAGDLRLGRVLFQDGQEIAGQAHGRVSGQWGGTWVCYRVDPGLASRNAQGLRGAVPA